MGEEENQQDLVANRLTVVPAVAVYSTGGGSGAVRGGIGVSASPITCRPEATDAEPSLGTWYGTGARLTVLIDPDDAGPRSGRRSQYEERLVGLGRQMMMVSTEALLGAVQGKSAWGDSGEKAGRFLVWKWSYGDIDQIVVGRVKKMFKLWDAELLVSSTDPVATLHYSAFGSEGQAFSAYDGSAKAAKRDGSNLLGFAETLAQAVARYRGCEVRHTSDGSKDIEDVFMFA